MMQKKKIITMTKKYLTDGPKYISEIYDMLKTESTGCPTQYKLGGILLRCGDFKIHTKSIDAKHNLTIWQNKC